MKYNIGEAVYTIDIIDDIEEYTIIGEIKYKILGITYKTKYVCKRLRDGREKALDKREIHRIEK